MNRQEVDADLRAASVHQVRHPCVRPRSEIAVHFGGGDSNESLWLSQEAAAARILGLIIPSVIL